MLPPEAVCRPFGLAQPRGGGGDARDDHLDGKQASRVRREISQRLLDMHDRRGALLAWAKHGA